MMTEKKYKLTNETMTTEDGHLLRRIRAVRAFYNNAMLINKGQHGGWVESENNLSHYGTAWISDDAKVYDKAFVKENACVCDEATVRGHANIVKCAYVADRAVVDGYATIGGYAAMRDTAKAVEAAIISGEARISGDSIICQDANIVGRASITGDAIICRTDHYLTVGPIGSRNDTTTFFLSREGVIKVKCGCFLGTIDEFEEAVEKTHLRSRHARTYQTAIALAKERICTLMDSDYFVNGIGMIHIGKKKESSDFLSKKLQIGEN